MTDADSPTSSEPAAPVPTLSYATPQKTPQPDRRVFLSFDRFESFAVGGILSAAPLVLLTGPSILELPFLLGILQAILLGAMLNVRRAIVDLAPPREQYRYYLLAGFINGATVQAAVISVYVLRTMPLHALQLNVVSLTALLVVTSITAVLIWPRRRTG